MRTQIVHKSSIYIYIILFAVALSVFAFVPIASAADFEAIYIYGGGGGGDGLGGAGGAGGAGDGGSGGNGNVGGGGGGYIGFSGSGTGGNGGTSSTGYTGAPGSGSGIGGGGGGSYNAPTGSGSIGGSSGGNGDDFSFLPSGSTWSVGGGGGGYISKGGRGENSDGDSVMGGDHGGKGGGINGGKGTAGANGGGGEATLTLTADVGVTGNVEVKAGSGGSSNGGGGGAATLKSTGSIVANSVNVESGNKGTGDNPGDGGAAEFDVDRLTTKEIELIENGGGLTFKVGTLDVTTGNTELKVTGTTAGDVIIDTVELGGGNTLTVTGTGYTVNDLVVMEPGAKFSGTLDTSVGTDGVQRITFELGNSIPSSNIPVLTVESSNVNIDLDKLTLNFAGTLTLTQDTIITLIDATTKGAGAFFDSSLGFLKDLTDFTTTIGGLAFTLTDDNGKLIATYIYVDPNDGNKNGGGGSGSGGNKNGGTWVVIPNQDYTGPGTFLSQIDPLDLIINPTIVSLTDNETDKTLTVKALTAGNEDGHMYQWQIQQSDGSWKDIQGATDATYDYSGLSPGVHIVRCIVWNGLGGQVISHVSTVTVQ